MSDDQTKKQLEWLDEERRKDKTSLVALEGRVAALDGTLVGANQKIQDLTSEITHLKALLQRMDQYDRLLTQVKIDATRALEETEKNRQAREDEQAEIRRVQMDGLNKYISDLRKEMEQMPELQERMRARIEEEGRLNKILNDAKLELETWRRGAEEVQRSIRLLEESQRRDDRKMTELQSEAASVRKRSDEQRGRLDLLADGLRKAETRVSELSSVETERRESYAAFLEKQGLTQLERDQKWKDWQGRFDAIEKFGTDLETNLQSLAVSQRDMKRTQETVESLVEKVERRVTEITELQRLGEDRFRQEWVTFKSDDQKRWTNYTLSQDEQNREAVRTVTRLGEKLSELEDQSHLLADTVQDMNALIEKRLQAMLSMTREWVSDYEKILGGAR